MPCCRSFRAAGALAALLSVAVPGAAPAQNAQDQPLRGSIAPEALNAPADLGESPRAAEKRESPLGVAEGSQAEREEAGTDGADEGSNQGGPLGGMGDEPQAPEPSLEAEPAPVEVREEEPGPGLRAPVRQPLPLSDIIPPQRHDLDPYVPIGISIGSFLLFAETEIGGIFTDNVLGTRTDTHADRAFEVVPSLRLDSDWSRHFFSAEINGDRSWYQDFPTQDDRTYQALLRGRLDVTRRTHLELELEKSQTQEGRNSVSITDIAGQQTDLHEQHITASADHTFNRLTLKLTETVAEYDYDDVSDPTLIGPVPFQDIRDYREAETTLRGTYEFNPRMSVFVEGAVNERDYQQPISTEGIRRGSDGYVVSSGLIFQPTCKLFGEISVGYGKQDSIDETVQPIEGVLLNADLIWMPSPLTKVEFLARSEIDETTLVDSLGTIDRFYELSLQHAFWRYLVLGTYVSYEIADYVDNALVDQRVKEGLTAEYYFNPIVSVYGRYEHTDFFSTDTGNDFKENEVKVGMRLRR